MRERYEEKLALSLLKKHFSIYKGLNLSDKPDLIDEKCSIGVEVTRALNPSVEEREKYFEKKLNNRDRSEVEIDQIEKVEQYGLSIVSANDTWDSNGGKMLGLTRVFGIEEYEQLHNAIRKKYTKKYEKLKRIDLYIFFRHVCRDGLDDSDIERIFCTAYKCQEESCTIFENIMIDFCSTLLVFDLKNHEMKEIPYEEVG